MKRKLLSWRELDRRLVQERRKKKKIVFTNGCFDLVHAGHLKVFSQCRKWGDVLVVGLNSDASVRRIKGPKRPILTQNERGALLAAMALIDYVVFFNEDTPEKLIRMVKPDVLAKGGDWKADSIKGREFAKKVVRIPLLKGRSTSGLIDLIVKRYGRRSNKKTAC